MLLLALFVFVVGVAQAQTRKFTGKVVDEDGLPVIGALVVVEGTNLKVATNNDGVYTILNVPQDAKVLQVSCVGMETRKVTIKDGQTIMLESNSVLNEVMVVAYGTQKKSTFTGSASIINSDLIEKVQVTNAIDALKGKASGVQINTATGQPGSTPTIRIRGINSIEAGNAPLIVLDGAPYDGSLNDINPHDVESMTVLKDAASTALYGARGGNGVILITTKSAKRGQNVNITVDAKWGSNQKAVPEYETISDPAAHYEMWYQALKNMRMYGGASEADAHAFANANLINSNTYGLIYNIYNVPEGQYMIGTDGKLNPNATLGRVITGADGNQYMLTPDNWIDETYSNSLRQEYTVSASGATDRSTFYASANYLHNEGITYASDYERFTGRVKADYQLKKWLKTGVNMNYARFSRDALGDDGASNSSGNAFAFGLAAPIYPMYVRDANGNIIIHDATGMALYDYGQGTSYVGLSRPFLSQSNPVSDNRLQIANSEGHTLNATGTIELYLPYGFTFYSINTVNVADSRSTSTTNRYFGQYSSLNGQNAVGHGRDFSYNYQQRLNWHKTYGLHDIEVMAAHEYYRLKSYSLSAYKNQTFSDTNPELASAVVMGSASSYTSTYNTEQWLGRAMYNYDERYFAQGSLMTQASSKFHKDHRWGTFWSASAGWNLHKESWFKADWVDELKVKASYGQNGNDGISSFLYTNVSSIVNSNDEIALVPSTMGNEYITWEKNSKFNCGIDFSLFRNRLRGGIEFYSNKTTDMLSWFTLPASYGYTGYWANVGDMVNRGLEIELGGDIIRTKDFTWSMYANLTTNHNEITKLAEERKTMEVDGYSGFSSDNYYFGEGISRYSYYGKKYAGVCQQSDIDASQAEGGNGLLKQSDLGKALYYKTTKVTDAEGNESEVMTKVAKYNDADYHVLGDCLPDVYGGFGTSFAWKGIDLSVDFQYQIGGLVYDSNYATLMSLERGYAIHVDMLDAWSPENTSSNIPRMSFNDSDMARSCDRFLTNASYLTLSNITLGYTLPKKCAMAMGIGSLRLYCVADNIWTWSKRQGLDPRQSISGGNSSTYYKPIRTISGGVTVTF